MRGPPDPARVYVAPLPMAGKRVRNWSVLSVAALKSRRAHWLCRCDCGHHAILSGNVLRGPHRPSFPHCRKCGAREAIAIPNPDSNNED